MKVGERFNKWIKSKSKKFRDRFVLLLSFIILSEGIYIGYYIIPAMMKVPESIKYVMENIF